VTLDGVVRALDGFEAVLADVAPAAWNAPSPCAGWSAVDVVGHAIGNLRKLEADIEIEAGMRRAGASMPPSRSHDVLAKHTIFEYEEFKWRRSAPSATRCSR
jgi:uncharacterized protein (TIGR03083 family)